MTIPRQLRVLLLKRGNIRRIKDIEARARILRGAEYDVFTTQSASMAKKEQIANKGCVPCSSDIVAPNPAGKLRSSNRNRFFTIGGVAHSDQKMNFRLARKR